MNQSVSDACYANGVPYCFNGKCESSAASSTGAWCTCREFWKGIRCEQLDYVTFWKTVAKADKFAQIFFVGTVILTAMILSLWCYCIRKYCFKKKKSEDKLPISLSEASSVSGKSLDSNSKVNRINSTDSRSVSLRSQSSSIETNTESKLSTNNFILPAKINHSDINTISKDMLSLYEQFSQVGVPNYGTIGHNTVNRNTLSRGTLNSSHRVEPQRTESQGHYSTVSSHYGTVNHYGTGKRRKSKKQRNASNRNSIVTVNGTMSSQYS